MSIYVFAELQKRQRRNNSIEGEIENVDLKNRSAVCLSD